jgi:hypothetical protein
MSSGGADYFKYTNDLTPTNQFDWWHRFQNAGLWTSFVNCNTYAATNPDYPSGYAIELTDVILGLTCHTCTGCPPFTGFFEFDLPPGYFFDLEYTDGTNTFPRQNVADGDTVQVNISDTTTYQLVSITEHGGCPVPFHSVMVRLLMRRIIIPVHTVPCSFVLIMV